MTLALTLLKVSAVLALALSVAALGRRRSAAWRHWVLASGTACALLVPALTAVVPTLRVIAAAAPAPAPAPLDVRSIDANVGLAAPSRPGATTNATGALAFSLRPVDLIAGVWVAGVGIGIVSLIAGAGRLSRIASGAPLVGGEWVAQSRAISSALALQTPVRFRETAQASLLVTWGARRPEVLLPAGAASWPTQRIRMVVAHELAHVRRGDWPVQLLGELLRVVYWFNPLAWLVCRQLRHESERASDDVVLGLGIARTDYAAQLVELARTFVARPSVPIAALAIAHPSTLQRRIRAMLNVQLDRRPLSLASRLCGPIVMLLAVAPIAAIGGQAGATLSGTVTDPSGRAIPGVTLSLANPALDLKVQATTNESGVFNVPLIAGTYQLEARHPGFAVQTQGVTLGAGEHLQQALRLQIGTLRETINVTGGGPAGPVTTAAPPRRAAVAPKQCIPSSAGGQIVPPIKMRDVRPIYPAGTAPTTSTVSLEARIGVDGMVENVRPTAPVSPELEASAVTAVRQWEFTPALLNCEPIGVSMLVTVTFQAAR